MVLVHPTKNLNALIKKFPLPPDVTLIHLDYYFSEAFRRSKYKTFSIPKKNGTSRLIEDPVLELKRVQRWLLQVLRQVKLHPSVHGLGGVEKDAIANGLCHHSNKVIVTTDIHKFFPNTIYDKYMETLDCLSIKPPTKLELILAARYCFVFDQDGFTLRLPTGAPTSPLISNITFSPADWDLSSLATENNMVYTRYMDDITFSGSKYPKGLQSKINEIVQKQGYKLNHAKSKVLYRDNNPQIVTGVSLNHNVGIGRVYKRKLRAELDKYAKHCSGITTEPIFGDYLQGRMNYVRQVNSTQYSNFMKYFLKRWKYYRKIQESDDTTKKKEPTPEVLAPAYWY